MSLEQRLADAEELRRAIDSQVFKDAVASFHSDLVRALLGTDPRATDELTINAQRVRLLDELTDELRRRVSDPRVDLFNRRRHLQRVAPNSTEE